MHLIGCKNKWFAFEGGFGWCSMMVSLDCQLNLLLEIPGGENTLLVGLLRLLPQSADTRESNEGGKEPF